MKPLKPDGERHASTCECWKCLRGRSPGTSSQKPEPDPRMQRIDDAIRDFDARWGWLDKLW